ncbi:ABC transporter substrate-binding protein [Bradyrhizobium sp.]|uniref:ABC transporter substrate-binding protein n=1 Tax=Bradyrhizobium sp. TaxID=376 RepID=UPI001D33EC94|nr:ABC transporter substrate-binding protein [Bradyrhizobium sp.]MBI5323584.1 ABC transporter substrate-binding protein [Bradyrhizobium sp.]
MKRREFITMLGSAAALWPVAAFAQQPRKRHLGWLTTAPAGDVSPFLDALRAGLAAQGHVEGRNLTITARYADGDISRVPGLAEELAKLPVDLIVTQGTATRQLISTSAAVPVVYVFSADPVLAGLAESLARPGRRMTGITLLSAEMNGKRLELLREILPQIGRVAIVASPTHAGEELERKNSIEMAEKLGIAIQYYPTPTTEALRAAFIRMTLDPPQALVVFPDPITFTNRRPIVDFANGLRVPVISGWADFADSGALCTYGPRLVESYRRLAYYADRVLKGDNPAELPIERPTAFELVLNLKAAGTLGIQFPPALLARADRVIE